MSALKCHTVHTSGRCQAASRRNTVRTSALFQSKPKTEVKEAKPQKKQASKPERKQSMMSGVVDALDFANPSKADADILWETKANWKKGQSKMTPEQYAALARKVRGTAKDYFKEYVEEERVENTYYKPTNSTGTVPFLPLLVGVVVALLATTAYVVSQTS